MEIVDPLRKVVAYYENPESKWGYRIFTWDTKHFGYYPSGKGDVSEKKAQVNMMDLLAEKLKIEKGDTVLDAGCGRGTTSCYLATKYICKILGIDIVNFELDIARRRANEMGVSDRVEFLEMDYSNTSFADNYFDKIFTLETLVHSPDISKTLRELYRILKPGGRLALFEYSRSKPKDFTAKESKMLNLINSVSAMMSLDSMYHDDLGSIIERAGFKIISDDDISYNVEPSLKRFSRYARIPYYFIKLIGIQRHFINITAAIEYYNMARKGLIRYRVILIEK